MTRHHVATQRDDPRASPLLSYLFLFACCAPPTVAQFELAADLSPGTVQDSLFQLTISPEESLTVGGLTFFRGCTAVSGCEPWITDGTALGTQILVDAAAGPASGLGATSGFFLYDDLIYFVVDSKISSHLWRSDGTPEGTEVFIDRIGGEALRVIAGELWFAGWDAVHGSEPWTSDGTTSGTQMLVDLAPGIDSSAPTDFTVVGSNVFFAAEAPSTGRELYLSDGTGPGTVQVADINAGTSGSQPLDLTAVNSLLVFSADDGTSGRELWRSDGTGLGTYGIQDIHPGSTGSGPEPMGVLGAALLFHADNDTDGRELWKTDGSVAQQVKDIRSGGADSIGPSTLTYASAFAVFGNHLYFQADDGTHGEELWRSDGTEMGTILIADTNPATGADGSPDSLLVAGDRLWFSADDGVNGRELWATNVAGTAAQMVVNLDGTELSSMSERLTGFPGSSGTLFFGAAVGDLRRELWRADSPTGPFTRLTDVTAPDDSRPSDLTPFLDGVALIPITGPEEGQLVTWSAAQGAQVQAFFTGDVVAGFTVFQDTIFATDAGFEPDFLDYSGIWTFDGATPTLVVEQNTFGLAVRGSAQSGVVLTNNSVLLFTDGTPVATVEDLEIASAPLFGSPPVIDGDFVWIDDNHEDLWRADLQTASAEQIGDPTPGDESLLSVGAAGGKFYFFVAAIGTPSQLHASDGTAVGTVALGLSSPVNGYEAAELGDHAILGLFVDEGWEFYESDGTVAGTALLDTVPGDFGASQQLTTGGAWAYRATGAGIWVSDGTVAGSDMIPGTEGFEVHEVLDGFAVVSGIQEARGLEFALLEPNSGTLIPLAEVEPGIAGTEIGDTTLNGSVLWANAFRSDVGRELFRLDLSPWLSLLFADGFESGDSSRWSSDLP